MSMVGSEQFEIGNSEFGRKHARIKYAVWKSQRQVAGVRLDPEQEQWLDRMAEHIATSL